MGPIRRAAPADAPPTAPLRWSSPWPIMVWGALVRSPSPKQRVLHGLAGVVIARAIIGAARPAKRGRPRVAERTRRPDQHANAERRFGADRRTERLRSRCATLSAAPRRRSTKPRSCPGDLVRSERRGGAWPGSGQRLPRRCCGRGRSSRGRHVRDPWDLRGCFRACHGCSVSIWFEVADGSLESESRQQAFDLVELLDVIEVRGPIEAQVGEAATGRLKTCPPRGPGRFSLGSRIGNVAHVFIRRHLTGNPELTPRHTEPARAQPHRLTMRGGLNQPEYLPF